MRHVSVMLVTLLLVPFSTVRNIESREELRRAVALTFDDLPEVFSRDIATMRRNTPELLRVLRGHQAPAVGFVNEGKLHVAGELDARTEVLKQWVDAGMILGNHTYSHLRLFTYQIASIPLQIPTAHLSSGGAAAVPVSLIRDIASPNCVDAVLADSDRRA